MWHPRARIISLLTLIPARSFAEPIQPEATVWILSATGLLLFIAVPGLALAYGGLVRTRNALSAIFPLFSVTVVVSLAWFGLGYSLAFTHGGDLDTMIGGFKRAFLMGLTIEDGIRGVPESVYVMNQMAYAIIAPCIMVGSLVERMKVSALIGFTLLWSLLVYCPIAHWAWGSGWLNALGLVDFSGGLVVHTAAGIGGLTGAWLLGPRKGFPDSLTPPHNLPLCAIGIGFIWVGWHGFAPGHDLLTNGEAGLALLNTHIAGTAASLTWMGIEWYRLGKPSALGIMTGVLAGLGVISSGAGYLTPMGALMSGVVVSLISYPAILWVKAKIEVDDALDVFAIHGLAGITGSLSVVLFSHPLFGGHGLPGLNGFFGQLMIQFLGTSAVVLWSATLSFGILSLMNRTLGIRVRMDEETRGLDLALHENQAYYISESR